mmetsp:Transcript_26635/g.51606  ORF Transcript_26635/g.51606 Transcript_26635/m.51606 type:complete len:293 (-) Transcript_26635:22-900(-)
MRLQRNVKDVQEVERIFVYSHGFPDSSVLPNAVSEARRLGASGPRNPEAALFFSSRMPRKLCEMAMRKMKGKNAFVCFNTRGIPGSGGAFRAKTLTGDLLDLHCAVLAAQRHYPRAKQVILCGLSTGALLSLGYLADPRCELTRPSCAILFACVDDIPASKSLDFTAEQQRAMREKGFCMKDFYPPGCQGVPEKRRLDVGYLDSYEAFLAPEETAKRVKTPVILVHGTADKHVPFGHATRLLQHMQTHSPMGPDGVELLKIEGGNHFLSSKKHFKQAEKGILAFLSRILGSC